MYIFRNHMFTLISPMQRQQMPPRLCPSVFVSFLSHGESPRSQKKKSTYLCTWSILCYTQNIVTMTPYMVILMRL